MQREKLAARLAKQGRQVSCEALNRVVSTACESGNVVGAIALFDALRNRGLVAGIPVAGSLTPSRLPYSQPLPPQILGIEYEQILLSDIESDDSVDAASSSSSSTATTAAANRKSSSAGVVTESADSTFDVDISELDSESESDTETEAFTSTDDGFFSTPAAALLLYTSLILGAHKARKDSVMKRLYGLLHEDGLVPNRPIMTRMVASLPYADDPAGAIELYEYIRHLGIQMDGFMYGHVIAALLVGSESQKWWDTALLLTHRMHMAVAASHDTSVQTSLAVTAGKNGWVSELLQLYRMMIQDGVMPRGITWNACKL